VTEIADYLRLLLARVGETWCSTCRALVPRHSVDSILESILANGGEEVTISAPLRSAGAESPEAAWARALSRGFVRARLAGAEPTGAPAPEWSRLDEPLPEGVGRRGHAEVEVLVDRLRTTPENRMRVREALELAAREGSGSVHVTQASGARATYFDGRTCSTCGHSFPEPRPQLFSFNSPYGACPECRGFGNILTFTLARVVPDPGKSVWEGALDPWANSWRGYFQPKLKAVAAEHGIPLDKPFRSLTPEHQKILLHGAPGFRGVFPFLERLRARSYKPSARFLVRRYQETASCGTCGGLRLKPEALEVRVRGKNVAELSAMTVGALREFVSALSFDSARAAVAAPILAELHGRLEYLGETGLDYLTLDRPSKTLSGGEAQRIELANALGGSLSHALYVLDEPTVGLHPRDTERLIRVLRRLQERENTVLVVEHDPDVIAASDWIVELGPGAGHRGGKLLYQGALASWPGRAAATEALEPPEPPEPGPAASARAAGNASGVAESRRAAYGGRGGSRNAERWLTVRGASEHNLKRIDVRFPVGSLTGVCGVSGSGKSTLVEEVLWRAAARHLGLDAPEPGAHGSVKGLEPFDRAALVDQSPVARSTRSNPATYVKAFDRIRERYARAPLARQRRYTPGTFSFNVAGGRCETCEGAGVTRVEMYFLADLWIPCETCSGRRYRNEILDVRVHGHSIDELLDRTVEETLAIFQGETEIQEPLWILDRVGLGYLKLGQPLSTLSGGEVQRLKLARELSDRSAATALYILDEPTVGLHRKDTRTLLSVLRELTRRGATIIAVEHNLDFLNACDFLLELGPDGGDGGGYVVASGTPAELARDSGSPTGSYLRKMAACA
jgi:excinuclease ABC subunit A